MQHGMAHKKHRVQGGWAAVGGGASAGTHKVLNHRRSQQEDGSKFAPDASKPPDMTRSAMAGWSQSSVKLSSATAHEGCIGSAETSSVLVEPCRIQLMAERGEAHPSQDKTNVPLGSSKHKCVMASRVPRSFSWVEEGLLCGLAFPSSEEHIQYLVENNVHYLVNLTEDRSAPADSFPDLKIVRIGIPDFTSPTLEQAQQFLDVIQQAKDEQKAVGVHCNMGKGRTGTLLACFLVAHHQLAPAQAIQLLKSQRPGSVQTRKQQQFIRNFECYWKRLSRK